MNDLLITAILTGLIFIFAMLFGFYATLVLLIILFIGLLWWANEKDY